MLWLRGLQAQQFFAGYMLEQSLSVDNLFVFILMFSYFKVPVELEGKVLNYGIYGAAILRAGFIGECLTLLHFNVFPHAAISASMFACFTSVHL